MNKLIKVLLFVAVLCAVSAFAVACDNTYIEEHKIVEMELRSAPEKIDYELGETFSSKGLSLKVYYDDGFFAYVSEGIECSIKEGAPITTENKSFTAKYQGWSVECAINVSLPEDLFSVLGEGYKTLRLEAEDGEQNIPDGSSIVVKGENTAFNNPSGDRFLNTLTKDATVTFNVTADKAGWCVVAFRLGSVGIAGDRIGANRSFDDCYSISVNGKSVSVTTNPIYTAYDYQTDGSGSSMGFYNWTLKPIAVFNLQEGENEIVISRAGTGTDGGKWLNFDCMELYSDAELTVAPKTVE